MKLKSVAINHSSKNREGKKKKDLTLYIPIGIALKEH